MIRRKNKLELITAGDVGQKNKAMADSLNSYVVSTN